MDDTESLLDQAKHGFGALLGQPNEFQSDPHHRVWISKPEVRASLKRLARARVSGHAGSDADVNALAQAYVAVSGAAPEAANARVQGVLGALQAALQQGAESIPSVSIHAGFAYTHERLDGLADTVESLSRAPSSFASHTVVAHHETDARRQLDKILRRRFSPNADAISELDQLLRDLEDGGKYSGAPRDVTISVLDWTIRIAASKQRYEDAAQAFERVKSLGATPTPVAQAWLEVAQDRLDEALRLVREIASPDCRTAVLAFLSKRDGPEKLLAYVAALDLSAADALSPGGWRLATAALLQGGHFEAALKALEGLPSTHFEDCPPLALLKGIAYSTQFVAEPYRYRIVQEEFLATVGHLLEGPEADQLKAKAKAAFSHAEKLAMECDDEWAARVARTWRRWVQMVTPLDQMAETEALRQDLKAPEKAVRDIAFAAAFDVSFDTGPLEAHLSRRALLGELSPAEFQAKVHLLRLLGRTRELVEFITTSRVSLNSPDYEGLTGLLIESYVSLRECGNAEKILEQEKKNLHAADVPRFRLMISHCRGEDPTAQALENFKQTDSVQDLWNLVTGLRGAGRWSELLPIALNLYGREPTTDVALLCVDCFHGAKAPPEELLAFLTNSPHLVDAHPRLTSAKAWAHFHTGDLASAGALNNRLLSTRHDVNDVGLDINIAIRSGDWERFGALLTREWDHRATLPVDICLRLAQLAGPAAPDKAVQLAQEVVEANAKDPRILLQAYSVVSPLARDDIGLPWVNEAARLSVDGEGPVTTHNLREVVDILGSNAEGWRRKNDLLRKGEVPLHYAAALLNIPISHLLIAIPRQNKREPDARRRIPIGIRSGARKRLALDQLEGIYLDVTSLFVLNELDILPAALSCFRRVILSPRIMEVLLHDRDKAAFHQPSRIKDALPFVKAISEGRLHVATGVPAKELAGEVGEESAALLLAAESADGYVVHAGPLYKIGSYLEATADIGSLQARLITPSTIAHLLLQEGGITATVAERAMSRLGRGGDAALTVHVAAQTTLYLDRVAAEELSRAGLLQPLLSSRHRVWVHRSAREEWDGLVATEPHAAQMVDAINKLRLSIRKAVAAGIVRFGPESPREEEDEQMGAAGLAVHDLFQGADLVDTICIDDRFLNRDQFLQTRQGKRVPICCVDDLLDVFVQRNAISPGMRDEARHALREATFFSTPLMPEELGTLVAAATVSPEGVISETAELRVVREHLARLHSGDVFGQRDLDYLDELWHNSLSAIRTIWADESIPESAAAARCEWLVANVMPDVELALRHSGERAQRTRELAIGRLMVSIRPLPQLTQARRKAYSGWLEQSFVRPNAPGNIPIIETTAARLVEAIKRAALEVADEYRESGGTSDGSGPSKERP